MKNDQIIRFNLTVTAQMVRASDSTSHEYGGRSAVQPREGPPNKTHCVRAGWLFICLVGWVSSAPPYVICGAFVLVGLPTLLGGAELTQPTCAGAGVADVDFGVTLEALEINLLHMAADGIAFCAGH